MATSFKFLTKTPILYLMFSDFTPNFKTFFSWVFSYKPTRLRIKGASRVENLNVVTFLGMRFSILSKLNIYVENIYEMKVVMKV